MRLKNQTYRKKVVFTRGEYLTLLNAYQNLSKVFFDIEEKRIKPSRKSLYGIWKGIDVAEREIKEAKKSLFKTSL